MTRHEKKTNERNKTCEERDKKRTLKNKLKKIHSKNELIRPAAAVRSWFKTKTGHPDLTWWNTRVYFLFTSFFQMRKWLDRTSLWSVYPVPRMPTRFLQRPLAMQLPRRLGRSLLQPGPELLHQQQALPQRSHLLQHRPGFVHLQLPSRLHRHKLRKPDDKRMFTSALPQRWNLSSKFLFSQMTILFFFIKLTVWHDKTLRQSKLVANIFFLLRN